MRGEINYHCGFPEWNTPSALQRHPTHSRYAGSNHMLKPLACYVVSCALGATIVPPLAAQNVLSVDASGGGLFTDIQPAVNAAAPGDILCVKTGLYSGFTIYAKPLVITAAAGASVDVRGQVVVENLAATQEVTIRGLSAVNLLRQSPATFRNNLGPIWIEDTTLRNGNLGQFGHSATGVLVLNCSALTFVRATILGSIGRVPQSGHGIEVAQSTVTLDDCQVVGAVGAMGNSVDGGDSLRVSLGFVFASGTRFQAGDGGNGVTIRISGITICYNGGDGGHGLHLTGASSQAITLGCTFTSGLGGNPGTGGAGCRGGADGVAVHVGAGIYQALPGGAKTLQADSPVAAGSNATITMTGLPGERALVILGPSQAPTYFPLLQGMLMLPTLPLVVDLGALPATGSTQLTLPIPAALPPGVQGYEVYFQGVLIRSGLPLRAVLSSPSVLVILDPAHC